MSELASVPIVPLSAALFTGQNQRIQREEMLRSIRMLQSEYEREIDLEEDTLP